MWISRYLGLVGWIGRENLISCNGVKARVPTFEGKWECRKGMTRPTKIWDKSSRFPHNMGGNFPQFLFILRKKTKNKKQKTK